MILSRVGKNRIAFLLHDAYYRDRSHIPFPERAEANFDHPDELETELLVRHIGELKAGRAVEMPVYDFKAYTRGYREAAGLCAGRLTSEQAKEATVIATRQYAKRQATWFRGESGVEWFDLDSAGALPGILARVAAFPGISPALPEACR